MLTFTPHLDAIDYLIIDAHAHPYFNRNCPSTGPVDYDDYAAGLKQAGIDRPVEGSELISVPHFGTVQIEPDWIVWTA